MCSSTDGARLYRRRHAVITSPAWWPFMAGSDGDVCARPINSYKRNRAGRVGAGQRHMGASTISTTAVRAIPGSGGLWARVELRLSGADMNPYHRHRRRRRRPDWTASSANCRSTCSGRQRPYAGEAAAALPRDAGRSGAAGCGQARWFRANGWATTSWTTTRARASGKCGSIERAVTDWELAGHFYTGLIRYEPFDLCISHRGPLRARRSVSRAAGGAGARRHRTVRCPGVGWRDWRGTPVSRSSSREPVPARGCIFGGVDPNPTEKNVFDWWCILFTGINNCDSIIGVGGCSPLDAVKSNPAQGRSP